MKIYILFLFILMMGCQDKFSNSNAIPTQEIKKTTEEPTKEILTSEEIEKPKNFSSNPNRKNISFDGISGKNDSLQNKKDYNNKHYSQNSNIAQPTSNEKDNLKNTKEENPPIEFAIPIEVPEIENISENENIKDNQNNFSSSHKMNANKISKEKNSLTNNKVIKVLDDTLQGNLYLLGANNSQQLIDKLSIAWKKIYPHVSLEISYFPSAECTEKVQDNDSKYHLAISSMPSQEAQKVELGNDSLAIIVHVQNPVTEITKEELGKIYSGEQNNWEEITSNISGQIILCGRKNDTGECSIMQQDILANYTGFLADMLECIDEQEILQKVSGNVYAIGFISYAYLKQKPELTNIKILKINGFGPSQNEYPIRYPLYLFFKENTEGDLVKKFIEFSKNTDVRQCLKASGYSF